MNTYKLLKIHICLKLDELKINKLFPELLLDSLIGDRQWKTEQFLWIAKLYKDNNFQLIADEKFRFK